MFVCIIMIVVNSGMLPYLRCCNEISGYAKITLTLTIGVEEDNVIFLA